jgi:hypothetical protein
MSKSYEANGQSLLEVIGAAVGLLLLSFGFLVLSFCL